MHLINDSYAEVMALRFAGDFNLVRVGIVTADGEPCSCIRDDMFNDN